MTRTELSEALFHAVRPDVDGDALCPGGDPYAYVARSIGQAAERLITQRELFRRAERALFHDIRFCFPLSRQAHVWQVIAAWVPRVDAELEALRRAGLDAAGNPLRCPVFTRRGTPCERAPLLHNGYCPSHQHLVGDAELQIA